jgi:hypothetical protein
VPPPLFVISAFAGRVFPHASSSLTSAWHMAKILECGAAAVAVRTQRFVPDSALEGDGFELPVPRENNYGS